MKERNSNSKHKIQIFFVVLWMLFLCSFVGLKFTASVFGWPEFKPFPAYENRSKAEFPKLKEKPLKQYGSSIEEWYNDNFAFRTDVINFYRDFHYFVLKAYFGREVPGVGDWVFRHGGDWAELDDYLGAIVLTEKQIADLITLFEGRVEWSRAHGSEFIQVITPVKAQMHPEKLPFMVRCHKGYGVSEQMKKALENSKAKDNVLFFDEVISDAVSDGKEVFYYEDHHLNAYGTYLLYRELNKYLAERYENVGLIDFYENPPEEVLKGEALGCYTRDRRLVVSRPGDKELCDRFIYATRGTRPFPLTNVGTVNDKDGISIAMAHDSIMRYALSSWTDKTAENLHFPLGEGVKTVRAYIFNRFSTGLMAFVLTDEVPDVFVEQFAECKFNQKIIGMDANIRKAAKFFNGNDLQENAKINAGDRIVVRAIFDNVALEGDNPEGKEMTKLTVKLFAGEEEIAKEITYPGVKRAVYFMVTVKDECDLSNISVEFTNKKVSFDKKQLSFRYVKK